MRATHRPESRSSWQQISVLRSHSTVAHSILPGLVDTFGKWAAWVTFVDAGGATADVAAEGDAAAVVAGADVCADGGRVGMVSADVGT